MNQPKWMRELLGNVCEACINEGKGRMSGFSCRWARPENNSWGCWLLQVAPAVIEFAGGKDDGATGYDFVNVDLLALPQCLDKVESLAYDPDYGQEPRLVLEGKRGRREVIVEIYFEPFENDEAQTIVDLNHGSWRDKQAGLE